MRIEVAIQQQTLCLFFFVGGRVLSGFYVVVGRVLSAIEVSMKAIIKIHKYVNMVKSENVQS